MMIVNKTEKSNQKFLPKYQLLTISGNDFCTTIYAPILFFLFLNK